MKKACQLFIFSFIVMTASSQKINIVHLWPGKVPGEKESKHLPVTSPDTSNHVIRLTDVTDPAIVVFEAEPSHNIGAGIVVCPGGGYSILAMDKEGYEIAKWLNKLGFTAFILQYRVPGKQEGALQDIQRAIRLIRSLAGQYKVNPAKLGVMGFSAGASLCARISMRYSDSIYFKIDNVDNLSAKPSFTMLIYPAYLDNGPIHTLTPELKVNKETPPMFIFETSDDPYGNSALVMAGALRDAKVSVELHFLPAGGHGYGLRSGNPAAETWPDLAEQWLKKTLSISR